VKRDWAYGAGLRPFNFENIESTLFKEMIRIPNCKLMRLYEYCIDFINVRPPKTKENTDQWPL